MKWLRKWFGAVRTTIQRRSPLSGPERLEGREVPATLTWNVGLGTGYWNVASNWTPDSGSAHVPTADDDVVFDSTASGNCSLSANALCRTLTVTSDYTGMLDLGGKTLTADDGGEDLRGVLNGGIVQNGTLVVYRGQMDVTGGTVAVNLVVGPGNADGTAYVNLGTNVGSSMQTESITVRQGGVAQVVKPALMDSVALYGNLEVKDGGALFFLATVDTVTIGNGGVITVDEGGLLDLASANVTKNNSASYISNYGTVQKTNSGTTTVDMGLKNEASTSLLVNSGGSQVNTADLKFTDDVPGTSFSVIQNDGDIELSNQCFLWAKDGYQQNGGNLRVMGQSSAGTIAGLYADDGKTAEINCGAVILSSGSDYHDSELWSNMTFKFGATSQLTFGINRTSCDQLYTSATVEITAGARAVLTERLGNTGGLSYKFVHTLNGITNTLTLDDQSGYTNNTIDKQNNDNDYVLSNP
jgi:hypothetical protein